MTVNRLCGSGLQAIVSAAQALMLGDAEIAVAGGTEVMSRAPFFAPAMRWGQRMGDATLVDGLNGALTDPFSQVLMGVTAENVAERYGISRTTQDEYALESQRRAAVAIAENRFVDQIAPVEVRRRGRSVVFDSDEYVRKDASIEELANLRTIFRKEGGSVTAGNASGINDGAAALVLATERAVKEHDLAPLARLVSYGHAGVDPSYMGIGPVPATRIALDRAGLTVADLDVVESNEAFAAQACAVANELGLDPVTTNPNGSGISLGHPVGATGAIIATKLLYELRRTSTRYGLATMCIGGGQESQRYSNAFDVISAGAKAMSGDGEARLEGKMQAWPMTVDRFIEHAARWHGMREVVSYLDSGLTERTDYAAIRTKASRLSNALLAYGIRPGDRIATLAMNSAAHLTAWYAIAGIGAVCHTLNPRLGQNQLAWIIDHANDRILMADGAFSEIAEALSGQCPPVERQLLFTPPHSSSSAELVDDFCASADCVCHWGQFDENSAAGLCYTSGTTGNPKGVLYSHRSNVLHTLMSIQPDALNLSARDTIMPVVPMYHANAWGLTFSAPAVGAKLVLPGNKLDGETLFTRLRDEGVTVSAAVPTVWIGLLDYLETHNEQLPRLSRVIVGGAAMTEALMRRFEAKGIEAIASWGMTELSPVGGISTPVTAVEAMPPEQQVPYRLKQGRVFFGIDMRICGENGQDLAHDGVTAGALQTRGPTVAAGYYGLEKSALTADGYLDTGDIATIDPLGYVQIVDRAKDIVKSGGEWISSLEIENAATLFPGVGLAAVIGIPHPKWDERPLLLVTVSTADGIDLDNLRDYLARKLPKWWLPDEIRIVESLPLGATGKIDKKVLRVQVLG